MLLPLGHVMLRCEPAGKLGGGRHEVPDREYRDRNCVLERTLIRSRESCRDSLRGRSADSAQPEIPIRNVKARTWEPPPAASEGKPEKRIQWVRVD